jgi:hypothetical protein
MQLTETRRESQAGYVYPPANQAKHFRGLEWVLLESAASARCIMCMFAMLLCFFGKGEYGLVHLKGDSS